MATASSATVNALGAPLSLSGIEAYAAYVATALESSSPAPEYLDLGEEILAVLKLGLGSKIAYTKRFGASRPANEEVDLSLFLAQCTLARLAKDPEPNGVQKQIEAYQKTLADLRAQKGRSTTATRQAVRDTKDFFRAYGEVIREYALV